MWAHRLLDGPSLFPYACPYCPKRLRLRRQSLSPLEESDFYLKESHRERLGFPQKSGSHSDTVKQHYPLHRGYRFQQKREGRLKQ